MNPIQQAIEGLEWIQLVFTDDTMAQERDPELWLPRLNEALSALQSLQGVELPPLLPSDHPEPHTLVWSKVEIEAIQAYARTAVAAAMARGAVPQGYTLVPDAALRWLFGEEGDFVCPPDRYFRGAAPPYWWRSVFRDWIAAAPTPEATQPTQAEAAGCEALKARIAELEAELAPYREAAAVAEREAAAKDRAEQIVSLLFPPFSGTAARSDPSKRPPQWHEKSWWWNGASIKWHKSEFSSNGGTLILSSYVGGGEVEETDLDIPKSWIDASDDEWPDIVTAFRDQQVQKRASAEAAKKAADAQRQIAAAQETLRRLGASQ